MKKFFVLLVVVAITCFSAMAFAADVTVGGSIELRSRDFSNLELDKNIDSSNNKQVDTQTRVKLDVNVKAGDNVKGKVELWHDFGTWGASAIGAGSGSGLETAGTGDAGGLGFREAWINFNMPGIPVNVTGGHQLLALGQQGFFRSMHFGSDAWVVANVTGNNTIALVDVKAWEGATNRGGDDIDAYVLLDVFKIDDKNMVGIDITDVIDRAGTLDTPAISALGRAGLGGAYNNIDLQNIGLWYGGALGPLNLKAELDVQMGKAKTAVGGSDAKFKGNQIIVKGDIPVDPLSINFTVARGSGLKKDFSGPGGTGTHDIDQFITILDIDPHYTFLYEYKIPTVALNAVSKGAANDSLNTGYANTTALNVGASYAVSKSLNIALNLWYLKATEKVVNAHGDETDDIGNEIDAKISWKLYDNLSWNWDLGYFMPGKVYKKANDDNGDAATGIQGILALSF